MSLRITTYRKGALSLSHAKFGMYVHQATISVTVMNSSAKLIVEGIVETKAETILDFVQGIQGELSVAFEEDTAAAVKL